MICHFRKRSVAFFLFIIFFFSNALHTYALTGGPSQPESSQFTPAGASDMVDLFTGDFNYNIPLFELPGPNGGYPFNISYQAGIGMDQEASWVGLGWSLNPGAINRQMRGLPDEFNGDMIHTKASMEPSVTVGLGAGASIELIGKDNALNNNKITPSLSVGFSVTQNNYKGFGYSMDVSVGAAYHKSANSGKSMGIGLDISLNSTEGINVQPSLSLAEQFTIKGGYNSKEGFNNISFTQQFARGEYTKKDDGKKDFNGSLSYSASLSLAHPGYTPQISMPMQNYSLSATIKFGGAWWLVFGSPYFTGFYNQQQLKNNGKRTSARAFGYLNYQNANQAEDVLDFNREKDGVVTSVTPNLAIPFQTYDIYSVNGQGISAMYRPMRNDYGVLHDPETVSESIGGSAGFDAAPAAAHVGVNAKLNHSRSVSGLWNTKPLTDLAQFENFKSDTLFQPWYFKVHGEPSRKDLIMYNALHKDEPVRLEIDGSNYYTSLNGKVKPSNKINATASSLPADKNFGKRHERNQLIQTLTNGELVSNGKELMPIFNITYLDNLGVERKFNRSSPNHHIAAFIATTPEGLRYNYGLPAYNLLQEEVTFTASKKDNTGKVLVGNNGGDDPDHKVKDTEKFLRKVETPAYAHSHLLTSIIGPDYVDITGDGITSDDLGYWVKFTYQKTTSASVKYKWRDPYFKASLQDGYKTDPRDDKGYFIYGEKELWYLTKAETKTHIATFKLSPRDDGRGVNQKLQDSPTTKGTPLQKLDEIRLFTRSAGPEFPIKVTKFEYDYSLCKGVYNNINANSGKLTLKKLHFEHGNSKRGRFNPYQFNYNEGYSYDQNAYDRWGNYKPYPDNDPSYNIDFPYSLQDPSKKVEIDNYISAWSLKEIVLPSGGKIQVDYETDDYGYVQHLQAMQMTEIVNPYVSVNSAAASTEFNLNDDTKIRFKLETPLDGVLDSAKQKFEVLKYLDVDHGQIYFKAKINLRSSSEDFFEYINGYADIDLKKSMFLEKDNTGKYVYGVFYLLKEEKGKHPFSVRAWQHLRTNQPSLALNGRKLEVASSTDEKISQMKSLGGNIFTQIRQMFEGFNDYCRNKGWGREIQADRSWVRLKSPDKVKYGGGLRVKQITIKDNWSPNSEGIYGQYYDYTTTENNNIISSGVAAYEPLIGGDENPHRYAKKYTQSKPLASPNRLFFEYPINESYYPGPQVGYQKVSVYSLASAFLAGKKLSNITLQDGKDVFPKGNNVSFGTTGLTVHEFYTAKDFPTITEETEIETRPYKLVVPVPFLGSINFYKLTASQGYSVITNDMHGKVKKVSNYRQSPNGSIEKSATSWVQYNYGQKKRFYNGKSVYEVINKFKETPGGFLEALDKDSEQIATHTIGQEEEFFIDLRNFEDNSWEGGGAYNADFVFFFFGAAVAPSAWPAISSYTTELKTAVTNKVIFKSGILLSTEAYDEGATVVTQNLKWNSVTGTPQLVTINNEFGGQVYKLLIPAFTKYQGMGAAFKNIGFRFNIKEVDNLPFHDQHYQFSAKPEVLNNLYEGDEVLLYAQGSNYNNPIAKVTYMGKQNGDHIIHSSSALQLNDFEAMIVRSGFRNQLAINTSEIVALKDPSIEGNQVSYQKTITVPKRIQ